MHLAKHFFIVCLTMAIALSSCGGDSDREHKKFTPPEPSFVDEGNLFFINKKDTLSTIDIEIADSPARRQRGLMYRKSMANNAGMIFIFDQAEPQSFWMENTYIPLDILFISADFEILKIARNTVPYARTSVGCKEPAKYVLEVNGDYCKTYNIDVGQYISFNRQ